MVGPEQSAAGEQDPGRWQRAVTAAQARHETGWEELHELCAERIRLLVKRLAGRRLLARETEDELVLHAIGSLFEGLPHLEYRSEGEFLAWLRRLVQSTITKRALFFRARKRPPPGLSIEPSGSEAPGGVHESQIGSPGPGPATQAQRQDEFAYLLRCARRLGEADREVLNLFLDLGDDMRALGAALGISEDAARMRWLRVRRRLIDIASNGKSAA